MSGSRSVTVRAKDTNVLVIAVATSTHIAKLGLEKTWIAFGQAVDTQVTF